MKYDVIMSLGYNCEISFRIENYFGKINAMPFSWSYELDRDRFVDVLANIDCLLSGEIELCDDQMICDVKNQIKFHPRYDVLRKYGTPTKETYEECALELRERVEHLKGKFKDLLQSEKNTLFIMKVEDKGEEDNLTYVKRVVDTLQKIYTSGKFTLVAVFEKTAMTPSVKGLEDIYGRELLKIYSLKKFAPKKHTDTMGDTRGWKKILFETTGIVDTGYNRRLYQKRKHWTIDVIRRRLGVTNKNGK